MGPFSRVTSRITTRSIGRPAESGPGLSRLPMIPAESVPADLEPAQLAGLLLLPQIAFLGIGLIVAQISASVARLKVGPVVAADRRDANRRRVVMTVTLLAALGWVVVSRQIDWKPVVLCVASAILLVFTTPSSTTAVLGLGGVQRGWHARRFESLEEWRLTGDHLRFRLFGEWTSVPCPKDHQAGLRAKLEQLVPDRESAFQD